MSARTCDRQQSSTRRLVRRLAFWVTGVAAVAAWVGWAGWRALHQSRMDWMHNARTEALLDAVQREPEDPELVYTAAYRLNQELRYEAALPLAERALAMQPEEAHTQILMGYILRALKRPAEALRYWEIAARRTPGLAAAHREIGFLYAQAGLPEEAVPHLRASWNASTPDVGVQVRLIDALIDMGQLSEAERMVLLSRQFAPPNGLEPHLQFYRICKAQGRASEAERSMLDHLRENRYSLTAPYLAALTMVVLDRPVGPGRVALADRLSSQALMREAELPATCEAVGATRFHQGKHVEAVRYLRRAVRERPELGAARQLLARSLRALGRGAEAQKYDPPTYPPLDRHAVATLEARLGGRGDEAATRLELTRLHEGSGDLRRAFQTCWPLVNQDRPNPQAVEMANRLLLALLARPQVLRPVG